MKTRSARNEPAASVGVLVDADWLDAHLHDPAVRPDARSSGRAGLTAYHPLPVLPIVDMSVL